VGKSVGIARTRLVLFVTLFIVLNIVLITVYKDGSALTTELGLGVDRNLHPQCAARERDDDCHSLRKYQVLK
jgi:hypothetical protein